MSSEVSKKIQKLKKFMKKCHSNIYEWTYYSKLALTANYKYLDVYSDLAKIVMEDFGTECKIYNLGSRPMALAVEEESDLDVFIDFGEF